ncbi:hypothetical protein [Streptomyces sp. NPDC058674]|uniref:hypothetical protein n=1 Tax=Streptomyces sp. NPDC058674 TaxID=3346592 RepID=UPI003665E59B
MPERVYLNRRPGEERIHIEITYGEIRELLTRPAGEAARQLWQILATADRDFNAQAPAPELTDADREYAADVEETAAEHARGEHDHCGPTCETRFPGDQLRNFILAKGYPGTAGMLDELLRRASTAAPTPGPVPAFSVAERQFLTFALDQAAEEMSLRDGFTDEDQAALDRFRRMAAEEQQL